MNNEGQLLDPYEYLPGRCLRINEKGNFWNKANTYCKDNENVTFSPYVQSDKAELLKYALNSQRRWTELPHPSYWYNGKSDRIRGIWKWNGTENLKDSNWVYEYKCQSRHGYICEAVPETLIDYSSTPFIALVALVGFLLIIILGLIVYICSLKRRSKAFPTEVNMTNEVNGMRELNEGHDDNQGNLNNRHRHDSENSLYGQY
ncbi:unnamed protein product [Meganyctiphanes norvegica]|uniref:C-type lectin domain-containing protein n=1 Tax=Meganyctiphanes norvegica TaxID=48144 RepID=A0AAV2SMJ0_MEGNR